MNPIQFIYENFGNIIAISECFSYNFYNPITTLFLFYFIQFIANYIKTYFPPIAILFISIYYPFISKKYSPFFYITNYLHKPINNPPLLQKYIQEIQIYADFIKTIYHQQPNNNLLQYYILIYDLQNEISNIALSKNINLISLLTTKNKILNCNSTIEDISNIIYAQEYNIEPILFIHGDIQSNFATLLSIFIL